MKRKAVQEGIKMKERQKQTYRRTEHRFIGKHPVIGFLLLILMILAVWLVVGNGLELFLRFVVPVFEATENVGFGIAVAGLVSLLLFRLWFRPEYGGCLGKSGLKTGLLLGLIYFGYLFVGIIPDIVSTGRLPFRALTLQMVATSTMAGIWEEATFRGLPIAYLMRQMKSANRIPWAVVLTSAAFGLMHGSNALLGADVGSTVVQVAASFGVGVFFAAVYLRSGNLWPSILLHFTQDIIALSAGSASEMGLVTASVNWMDWINLGLCAVVAAIGFWLIRPGKRPEIDAVWAEKWKLPAEPASDAAPEE